MKPENHEGPAVDRIIRIKFEPTNPGQVFACCGLLELADRLWHGVEGWFEARDFCLQPLGNFTPSASELIRALANCRVTHSLTDAEIQRLSELKIEKDKEKAAEKSELESKRRESSIRLHEPFSLTIDWFKDDRAGGNRFKTWAGQQSAIDIAVGMHQPLRNQWVDLSPQEWLGRAERVDSLPFYFDSSLSGQGSAIDAGFSFDPLNFKMPPRPLLEIAAFVGLQRFRPRRVSNENLYQFDLWPTPLLPSAAASAISGALAAKSRRYQFRLLYRTDYLKSFLPAQPDRGRNHD